MEEMYIERFLSSIDKSGNCWLWTGTMGGKKENMYGVLKMNRKTFRSHRFSYEYYKGKIPEGMFVCHTCDNPPCVNPDHLFIGTQSDNMRDMLTKGRTPKAKLRLDEVRYIFDYKGDMSYSELGEKFKVSVGTIENVKSGRSWHWVTGAKRVGHKGDKHTFDLLVATLRKMKSAKTGYIGHKMWSEPGRVFKNDHARPAASLLKKAMKEGLVRFKLDGKGKRWSLTDKGENYGI